MCYLYYVKFVEITKLMYSFDELVSRQRKKCIKKWLKYELKFEKLNASLKELISIKIDDFNNFIKSRGIRKRSKIGFF